MAAVAGLAVADATAATAEAGASEVGGPAPVPHALPVGPPNPPFAFGDGSAPFASDASDPDLHELTRLLEYLFGTQWGDAADRLSDADERTFAAHSSSLIWGEIMPRGVRKILDPQHLHAADPHARVLCDLGCGFGRICVQAFLQYPQLHTVTGVELSPSRFALGVIGWTRLHQLLPDRFALSQPDADTIRITAPLAAAPSNAAAATTSASAEAQPRVRTLELRCANLFAPNMRDAWERAQVLVIQTAMPDTRKRDLVGLLSRIPRGARFLLYHSMPKLPGVHATAAAAAAAATTASSRASADAKTAVAPVGSAPKRVLPGAAAPRPPAIVFVPAHSPVSDLDAHDAAAQRDAKSAAAAATAAVPATTAPGVAVFHDLGPTHVYETSWAPAGFHFDVWVRAYADAPLGAAGASTAAVVPGATIVAGPTVAVAVAVSVKAPAAAAVPASS